ncbi:hypothetical protein AKJ16_DCAP13035 [Drosera capensis]
MPVILEDTKKMDVLLEMKKEKLELDRKTCQLDHKAYQNNVEWREEKLMTVDMTNLTDMQPGCQVMQCFLVYLFVVAAGYQVMYVLIVVTA